MHVLEVAGGCAGGHFVPDPLLLSTLKGGLYQNKKNRRSRIAVKQVLSVVVQDLCASFVKRLYPHRCQDVSPCLLPLLHIFCVTRQYVNWDKVLQQGLAFIKTSSCWPSCVSMSVKVCHGGKPQCFNETSLHTVDCEFPSLTHAYTCWSQGTNNQ